ncbi:alpha/beta hydrolase family protein [Myroides guanonis]|uniref:Dipeptidyl peptidase IV (DPP IV) N-terminal region n=1 Tax=Myroides guanonis TaxID=1150112 RepID=A0A1I3V1B3_9FLAO|nr:prolyl oligopeptidase family serine peptidase [Myroides guanonis]SFJ88912.1 Dipeptidyl peptidase IV (DPP IV) N-terminal region [Myroides guanonis]
MDIRRYCLFIALFYTTMSLATIQRDSISIDPRWNEWHVDAMAPNGDWAFLYKIYPNDRSKNEAFAVHTDTKKRVEVTGISQPQFTSNNFLIGTRIQEIVEVDLSTNIKTSLGVLSQRDWIEEEQTLCYINEKKELVLKKYAKKRNEIVWSKKGVTKYLVNPSKTSLLYQGEDSTELYFLDLKTLNEKKVLDLKEPLVAVTWNIQETVIAVSLKDNKILFVDLKKEETRVIELPKSESPIAELNLSFFLNNDLFISYKILNAEKDPVENYLDIWNGNDRDLKNKVRPRQKGELKAFFYKQSKTQLVELPRSEKQDYLNIGISNCLLVYEPLELQDYSQIYENKRYRILDLETLREKGDLAVSYSLDFNLNRSNNEKYIIYPNQNKWEVYDFESEERFEIPHKDEYSTPIWSSDSKTIYYQDESNLFVLDVVTKKKRQLTNFVGINQMSYQNKIQNSNSFYADITKPLVFSIRKPNEDKTSYYSLFNDKLTKMIDMTSNKLNLTYLNKGVSKDAKTVIWTEENYNQPSTVKVFRKGKVSTLLAPEVPEELYSWRKQKVIHYKDKFGVDLTGVLWYPKDFNPSKKYPMVTYIYDVGQGNDRSLFEIPTLYNPNGFNRTLLNEQGYFVFQADTYVSDEGPGLSAVECVTKGIENITSIEPSINKTKIGLIGHSFGGYKTSFILGNSKLFAAGVSGAGAHDLISWNYEYNYYRTIPNWLMLEKSQYNMKESFGDNPEKYYKNSPIHFAQNFETPVLLWTGMQDFNVHWENTRHMYVALQRYKKTVIALFYKKEGHSMWDNRIDLTYRVLDFFDYYLMDKKNVGWISKGVNYESY